MFSQGKRNDIIRELANLEHPDIATFDPMGQKSGAPKDTARDIVNDYCLGRTTIVRLIRIDKLTDSLKVLVDSGEIALRSGVELSFLSAETQDRIAEYADEYKIDMKTAKKLREAADGKGNIPDDTLTSIITGTDISLKPKPKSVKISNDTYSKYFGKGTKAKEITDTIEKALQFYFANMEETDDEDKKTSDT